MTLSMPLLLAVGMVWAPVIAGMIGFLGSWDARLLHREITVARALFNRSQIALSSLSAAVVFHALGGNPRVWPMALPICLAALAADVMVNTALVSSAAMLMSGQGLRRVVASVVLDSPWSFVLTYLSLAPIALLVAVATSEYGAWGLVASLIPLAIARQTFALRRTHAQAEAAVVAKDKLVREISETISDERRDERARLAMDLHDEALAALYQVHLMGEVLKQDLAYGRLFELEGDVPRLAAATSSATETLRSLIRSLWGSPVGARGLARTLDLLVEQVAGQTNASVQSDIRSVAVSASIQLLIYQVAREALENAVRHARARTISVSLFQEGGAVRLIVKDDGIGFLTRDVDDKSHFGLRIMRERAALAGGVVIVDSVPEEGTQVTARFPCMEDLGPPADRG
jgi:signal transduction histidine kinase